MASESLSCKIVLVETSQVAWIGSTTLTYRDLLEKPVEFD